MSCCLEQLLGILSCLCGAVRKSLHVRLYSLHVRLYLYRVYTVCTVLRLFMCTMYSFKIVHCELYSVKHSIVFSYIYTIQVYVCICMQCSVQSLAVLYSVLMQFTCLCVCLYFYWVSTHFCVYVFVCVIVSVHRSLSLSLCLSVWVCVYLRLRHCCMSVDIVVCTCTKRTRVFAHTSLFMCSECTPLCRVSAVLKPMMLGVCMCLNECIGMCTSVFVYLYVYCCVSAFVPLSLCMVCVRLSVGPVQLCRASAVLKRLKQLQHSCAGRLTDGSGKGEMWSRRALIVWCRQHAYTPLDTGSVHSFGVSFL